MCIPSATAGDLWKRYDGNGKGDGHRRFSHVLMAKPKAKSNTLTPTSINCLLYSDGNAHNVQSPITPAHRTVQTTFHQSMHQIYPRPSSAPSLPTEPDPLNVPRFASASAEWRNSHMDNPQSRKHTNTCQAVHLAAVSSRYCLCLSGWERWEPYGRWETDMCNVGRSHSPLLFPYPTYTCCSHPI